MTHTLHRFDRTPRKVSGDYVVLAMPARAFPADAAVARQMEFLSRALAYGPVNVGDSAHGAARRPRRGLGPTVHWRRDEAPDPEAVVERVDRPSAVSAVFDDFDAACAFLEDLKEDPPGLSINLSAPTNEAKEACRRVGLTRHSVEYSLGFLGRETRLPREDALALCTMCGHGMVAHGLARKMMERVRSGRRSPGEASAILARFCNCGTFNPARAERILGGATASDAASRPRPPEARR